MRLFAAASGALAVVTLAACGNKSGGVSGTPTPTPAPTPVTYALAVTPPSQSCNVAVAGVTETWGAPTVPVLVTATEFTPQWNLAGSTVLVAPSGTISGNNFTATWTDCAFDSLNAVTTRKAWSWTGTLSADRTTFTSSLVEVLNNASGNVADCSMVNANMTDCTSPGLTWTISGTKQ